MIKFENNNIKHVLILTAIIVIPSCNNKLMVIDDSRSSNEIFITVDKKTIKKLNFEPKYYCTTTRSKRIFLSSLENLRSNIISWDSDVELKSSDLLKMIGQTIVNPNKENQKEDFIQTDEREWICSEFEKIAISMQFKDLAEFKNFIDNRREW